MDLLNLLSTNILLVKVTAKQLEDIISLVDHKLLQLMKGIQFLYNKFSSQLRAAVER
jgi:hypothetical protein